MVTGSALQCYHFPQKVYSTTSIFKECRVAIGQTIATLPLDLAIFYLFCDDLIFLNFSLTINPYLKKIIQLLSPPPPIPTGPVVSTSVLPFSPVATAWVVTVCVVETATQVLFASK